MKILLATGVLAVLAVPVFAEEAAETPRLSELETMVITALKQEPETSTAASTERLRNLETMTITAVKEQPAEHKVDDKTAALLAELEKE